MDAGITKPTLSVLQTTSEEKQEFYKQHPPTLNAFLIRVVKYIFPHDPETLGLLQGYQQHKEATTDDEIKMFYALEKELMARVKATCIKPQP